MKIRNKTLLFIALGIVGIATAQDIPLIISGPLPDDITNRANDITFLFTSSGQSPAANVGWGNNPPDNFRLTLDLSNSKSFPSYYSVQLFKGVDPAIYTPGPYGRMKTPYALVLPGGFGYQLQKGVTYRLGIYDVAIIDRPDSATEDVVFKYEEQDNGGGGGGSGGGGGGNGGGGGSEVVPPGTAASIGLLGLLPVDAIISGLLPRNVDANPATAQRFLDEMMHSVLYNADGAGVEDLAGGLSKDGKTPIRPEREWNVWLRTFGGSIQGASGKLYQNDWEGYAGGLALGIERQFGAHGTAGIFGSYGRLGVLQDGFGGGGWSPNAFGGGLYARWDDSKWFLGAAVAGQYFEGQQTRGINYPGMNLEASGNRSAASLTAAIQSGVRLKAGAGLVFTPSLLADWSIIKEDGFTESGADIPFGGHTFKFSNLGYDDRSTQWLSTDLGVTTSRPTMLGHNRLTPSVRVAWRAMWQVQDDAQRINYSFSGRTLDVDGSWENQQNLAIGGALDFATAGGLSFYVRGEALIIGEASFSASAGASLRF